MRELILERIAEMKQYGGSHFYNGWRCVDLDHANLNDEDLLEAFIQMYTISEEEAV